MKELSHTLQEVPFSAIRKIFDMCIGVEDLIKFTVGEPDFQTSDHIIEAAYKAMKSGAMKYTSNRGIDELREELARYVKTKKNITADPKTEIMVTNGGMQALFMAMQAICNPGDEIIIGSPYFTNYLGQVMMCNAKPVFVQLHEENNFIFRMEDLRAAITDKTKAILLNSPCNPLGSIIDEKTLQEIADLAIEKDLYVITDEVYQDYRYDTDKEFVSIAALPGMKERTIVVDSFSKAYCMTGWRVGYAIAQPLIVDYMVKQQEAMASCVNAAAQYAALEALRGPKEQYQEMIQIFKERRDAFVEGINRIDKLSCVKPGGAFYLFVNIKETGLSSEEFAIRLLKEGKVAVIPGDGFGLGGEGYVRISYVTSMEDIKEGLRRIEKFIATL